MEVVQFATLEETKAFEGISSQNLDQELTTLLNGVNAFLTNIVFDLELKELEKESNKPVTFTLETNVAASDLIIHDESDNTISGLRGKYGTYTLDNEEFTGRFFVQIPTPSDVHPELKMAALYLVRHYRKSEYKDSMSSAGQSVTTVSLSSNIPKHILALINPHRVL